MVSLLFLHLQSFTFCLQKSMRRPLFSAQVASASSVDDLRWIKCIMFQTLLWLVLNNLAVPIWVFQKCHISKSPGKVQNVFHFAPGVSCVIGLDLQYAMLQLCQLLSYGFGSLSGAVLWSTHQGSNSLWVLLLSAANDASWAACKTTLGEWWDPELMACFVVPYVLQPFFNYKILTNYK